MLATDLQRHFQIVAALKLKVGIVGAPQSGKTSVVTKTRPALHTEEERDAMLEVAIKAADVGSAAKAPATYARWTDCIMTEASPVTQPAPEQYVFWGRVPIAPRLAVAPSLY